MTGLQLIEQLAPLLRLLPLPLWVADSEGRLLLTTRPFSSLCGDADSLHQVVQPPEVAASLLRPAGNAQSTEITAELAVGPQRGARVTITACVAELAGGSVAFGWLRFPEDEAHDPEWLINQIAHALRNPIFAASVQCEAISLRAMQSPEFAKPVGVLHRQLKRLESNIDEMLLLGRPAKVNIEEVQVAKLLGTIAEDYRQGARGEPAEVELVVDNHDLQVRWDARAVQIAIERIIDNAIQHTPEPHQVKLHARQGDDEVIIVVRDQGHGINEEIKSRVLLPFFPQHRGRPGLGLSIALKYVGALGGRIEIDSQPKQGTEVRCILPIVATDRS